MRMRSTTFFLKWKTFINFHLFFLMNFGSLTNFLSQKLTNLQQRKNKNYKCAQFSVFLIITLKIIILGLF